MSPLAAPIAPPARSAGPLPPTIKAAVTLWGACALLGLGNAGLGFVLSGFGVPVNASQRDPVGVAIALLFALLVLVLAYQTGGGRAAGTKSSGNASLLLAFLYAGFAVLSLLMIVTGQGWGGAEVGLYVAAALVGLQALFLLVAGFLAVRGQKAYEAWRAARTTRPASPVNA
ncbi:MAG: hypothetical protein J2P46_04750 [Zavarzinella sp.]|nr:hypothetical protein [Zavarzinella sp.]